MGVRRSSYQRSHSDPECFSSSEQSCDTAIYVGGRGVAPPAPLSDRELTDSENASSVVTVQLHGTVCGSSFSFEIFENYYYYYSATSTTATRVLLQYY